MRKIAGQLTGSPAHTTNAFGKDADQAIINGVENLITFDTSFILNASYIIQTLPSFSLSTAVAGKFRFKLALYHRRTSGLRGYFYTRLLINDSAVLFVENNSDFENTIYYPAFLNSILDLASGDTIKVTCMSLSGDSLVLGNASGVYQSSLQLEYLGA